MKKKDGKVVIHLLGCGVDEYLILEKISQHLVQGLMPDWKNCYTLQFFGHLDLGYLNFYPRDYCFGYTP